MSTPMMRICLFRGFFAIFLVLCLINTAQAVVTFRSSNSTGQTNGSPITVNKPAGTVSGDVMLASVAVVPNTAAVNTPPAGWTLLLSTNQTSTNTSRLYTYYKVAGAAEPASYSWTLSGGNTGVVAAVSSYYGVDTTAPIDASAAQATAKLLTHTAPSVTTTVTGDMLITVHEFASARNWTPPAGMTERVDRASRGKNNDGVSLELNTQLLLAVGATGTRTATASGNGDFGAAHTIALRSLPLLHHIRIQHDGTASTCAPEVVTLKACGDAACATLYTSTNVTNIGLSPTGGSYTWSPGTTVSILAAASGINSGITLARSSNGTASLAITGSPSPAPANPFVCYNTATAVSGVSGSAACNLVFGNNTFSYNVPDHTAIARQVVTLTSCTGNFASTTRTVKFWSTYVNPATGTVPARVVAGTGNADCSTGYSNLGTSSVSSTSLNLAFGTGVAPQATFSLCYPDVGQLQVDARYDGSAANTPSDAGVVILGNDRFITAPHHFVVSGISCVSGCFVTPNPAAASAAGAAFMKAGNPFSMTVTAYNSASAVTPNFGKEIPAESVTPTPTMLLDPDLTFPGAVSGVFGTFANGVASGSAFSFNEVGIMTLTGKLTSASYLASGLKEITTPSSVNIGRFTPNHFTLTTDLDSPIVTRTDFPPQIFTIIDAAGVIAPASIIPVNDTTGFAVGDNVRIPGAGASGNAFTATISSINSLATPPTLTLNAAISTSLTGGENVFNEWGSYMGERFDAQFSIWARDLADNVTQNYQGAYAKLNAKLNLVAAGNPLGLGVMDTATPTYNLALDTSLAATGVFAAGNAAIIAPLAVVRAASAVGPYSAVQVGIAPTDSDGIKMNAYNLGVTSATFDRTSIMDPLVQNVTAVRYGRMKISNAHGSEKLPLPIVLNAQYWNGSAYITNTEDNETVLAVANITPGNYQRKALDTWTTLVALPNGTASAGTWSATLATPAGTFTGRGSTDITLTVPSYLPSTPGRATFGVYKSSNQFIYMRENH